MDSLETKNVKTLHAECVLDLKNELGEGPVWNDEEGALYWVDCIARKLQRYIPGQPEVKTWSLSKQPGAFAFRGGGGLVMVYRTAFGFFDLEAGTEDFLGVAAVDFAKERFNDGKCDRKGRFWTGTIDRELSNPVGSLYRIDPDLRINRMDGGVTLSNGIAWSPDNKIMYYCDSHPGTVVRYDYDLESGDIANRSTFIDYSSKIGRPDGCTVDSEGFLWVTEVEAGQVGRYDHDGKLERVVKLPVPKPTSVMFGGEGLKTLFITSMRYGASADELAAQPLYGALFGVDPGVSGLSEPRFAG